MQRVSLEDIVDIHCAFGRQVEVVIDRFEGQNAREIFDYVESLAPPIQEPPAEEVARAEAQEAAKGKEAKEAEEATEEKKVSDEEAIRIARLDRIRKINAAAAAIDMVLSGPCQHILCLEAKKANATAAELCANADAKNAELKSLCQSCGWQKAARALEDEQVNYCTAEIGMRQAEDASNEEAKRMWQPHLLKASKNLAGAAATFDALEEERLKLTIEAARVEAAAKFAQAKADAANKIRGAQCPSFTSYIALEEFYAAQIEAQGPAGIAAQPFAEQTVQYVQEPYMVTSSESEAPLLIPFQHELYDFKAWEKGPELYKFNEPMTPQLKAASPAKMPTLTGNYTPAYGQQYPMKGPTTAYPSTSSFLVPSVTNTTTEVRAAAKDASLYSTQDGDTSEGFQKGNSISIPLPTDSAGPLLPADAVSATQDASKAEELRAELVMPC